MDKTTAYKNLILSCADFSDRPEVFPEPTTDQGIANVLGDIFQAEKDYEIKRAGIYSAATDWFQGLCGVCEVPYMRGDIESFLADNELDSDMIESYWDDLGETFVDMIGAKNDNKRVQAYGPIMQRWQDVRPNRRFQGQI
jgi:hypothetical protein